ncbi:response regulator [candidate division KSB1 bacterium]
MIRVLIADDHSIVREGLKQIVSGTSEIEVKGEAGTGQEVLDMISGADFDVVLLDISMPGRGGLEVLDELKRMQPSVPVLVLSMHPEEQYAVRVLRSGAAGYLTKESAPNELIGAIRKVADGGKYVSSTLADKLASLIETDYERKPHETLSNREFQTLCLIASGKTISQIAEELSLSVKTISTYRERILLKMDLKSNSELTYYAIKNNLVL